MNERRRAGPPAFGGERDEHAGGLVALHDRTGQHRRQDVAVQWCASPGLSRARPPAHQRTSGSKPPRRSAIGTPCCCRGGGRFCADRAAVTSRKTARARTLFAGDFGAWISQLSGDDSSTLVRGICKRLPLTAHVKIRTRRGPLAAGSFIRQRADCPRQADPAAGV